MSYYVNPHKFSCPWYPYAQEFGAPNIKWCEETLCNWISEPANTYSNFAYIIIALILSAYSARKEKSFDLDMFPRLLFILGIGSGVYHASNNYLSQLLDFLLMYTFIFWGVTVNLKKMDKINDGNKFYFFGGITAAFMLITHIIYLSYIPIQFLIIFATLFFILSEFQARHKKDISYKFLGIGLLFIIAGEVFSILDLKRIMCDPKNHIIQGHAIWHLLSAIGLGFSYFHFAQEVPNRSEASDDSGLEPAPQFDEIPEENIVEQEIRPEEDITAEHQVDMDEVNEADSPDEEVITANLNTEEDTDIENEDQLSLFEDEDKKD